ncbi:MAG: JAB domain-containing protein [Eisenbergiella sp.]
MKTSEKTAEQGLPYEKFLQKGAESLTDAELLAVLLRTGPKVGESASKAHRDCPALALAEEVLRLPKGSRSGLSGLPSLSPSELMKVRGIGQVKAVRICCTAELARRISLYTRKKLPAFPDPATAAAYARPLFDADGGNVERAVLLLVDGTGRLVHEKLLSVELLIRRSFPRGKFLQALRVQAVSFILLHNHPSGDPSPSREDTAITGRLFELGEMMQLNLTDHIIVGAGQYFSFRESGLI